MQEPITVAIVRLPHGSDLPLPAYQTPHSAGMDLMAAIGEPIRLAPMQRMLVATGITIALPPGFEAQVRPRSGLAFKHGIGMVNSPGTIDADYRGEIKVLLINLGQETFEITRGMRIAQMVICPVQQALWDEKKTVEELPASDRGAGGFGSTGVR